MKYTADGKLIVDEDDDDEEQKRRKRRATDNAGTFVVDRRFVRYRARYSMFKCKTGGSFGSRKALKFAATSATQTKQNNDDDNDDDDNDGNSLWHQSASKRAKVIYSCCDTWFYKNIFFFRIREIRR